LLQIRRKIEREVGATGRVLFINVFCFLPKKNNIDEQAHVPWLIIHFFPKAGISFDPNL
jgi:hypothetical protein